MHEDGWTPAGSLLLLGRSAHTSPLLQSMKSVGAEQDECSAGRGAGRWGWAQLQQVNLPQEFLQDERDQLGRGGLRGDGWGRSSRKGQGEQRVQMLRRRKMLYERGGEKQ